MRLSAMNLATIAIVLAAAGLSGCVSAPKRIGPWCAIADQGGNLVTQDCSYFSVDECRQAILGGNRGVCGRNPRWRRTGACRTARRQWVQGQPQFGLNRVNAASEIGICKAVAMAARLRVYERARMRV